MNPHLRSLFTLPWFGFVPLVNTMLLVCLLASATNVQAQQPGWSVTGSLGTERTGHTTTLLANGKVLVAGGSGAGAKLNSTELYDPATDQWNTTGSLRSPRVNAVAVRLANGKVLVAGSSDVHGNTLGTILTSAEIYDPDTGT